MEKDGFGENNIFDAFVAETDGHVIGMAITYFRYSTWKGKRLYLEDLIVTEKSRGLSPLPKVFPVNFLREFTPNQLKPCG